MRLLILLILTVTAYAGPLDGYKTVKEREKFITDLKSKNIDVKTLTTTDAGNKIQLITCSNGQNLPAILIVGGVDANFPVTTETALNLAVLISKNDKLLSQYRFYIIPDCTPDQYAKISGKVKRVANGNSSKTDDDKDFEVGEDPNEDLNKDGYITMMRVKDKNGTHIPHPEHPEIMIKADPLKKEKGIYKIYSEGIDNDKDEDFNEDPGDGVAFNKNFTFKYPYFQKQAGPHQISEKESRAVADFAFKHPEIAAVLILTPDENLANTWKSNPKLEAMRVKRSLLKKDESYFKVIAGEYKKIMKTTDNPAPGSDRGSFTHWSYFHYGRWAYASRCWWIPTEKLKLKDSRASKEINKLLWFKKNKINGFVKWQKIKHPDFPGKEVEVGGFIPFASVTPPAKELNAIAEKHLKLLEKIAEQKPTLAILKFNVVSKGNDLYEIEAEIKNTGFTPTLPAMGSIARYLHPVQVELELGKSVKYYHGIGRSQIPVLAPGQTYKKKWLIISKSLPKTLHIKVYSPHLGTATQSTGVSK